MAKKKTRTAQRGSAKPKAKGAAKPTPKTSAKSTGGRKASTSRASAAKAGGKRTSKAASPSDSKKTASNQTVTEEMAAGKAVTKKTVAKKTAAKKTVAKKAVAKKAALKKAATRKAASKKAAAKKSTGKKSASSQATAAKPTGAAGKAAGGSGGARSGVVAPDATKPQIKVAVPDVPVPPTMREQVEEHLPEDELRKRKSGLTKKQLETLRNELLAKRAEIIGAVTSMGRDAYGADGDISNFPVHMADVGSDYYEQELTLGLMESERRLLMEIDEALIRMQRGTYGVCLVSGEPIGWPRLEIKPWARYCIRVVREREQRGLR